MLWTPGSMISSNTRAMKNGTRCQCRIFGLKSWLLCISVSGEVLKLLCEDTFFFFHKMELIDECLTGLRGLPWAKLGHISWWVNTSYMLSVITILKKVTCVTAYIHFPGWYPALWGPRQPAHYINPHLPFLSSGPWAPARVSLISTHQVSLLFRISLFLILFFFLQHVLLPWDNLKNNLVFKKVSSFHLRGSLTSGPPPGPPPLSYICQRRMVHMYSFSFLLFIVSK